MSRSKRRRPSQPSRTDTEQTSLKRVPTDPVVCDPAEVEAFIERTVSKPEERDAVISVLRSFHAGPLPDPETLRAYSELIPNGADRVMTMAERQSDHRIEMEKCVIPSREEQSKRGQVFAFIIALAFAGAGIVCVMYHYPWPAGIAWGTTLVGLVSAFVRGKRHQQD